MTTEHKNKWQCQECKNKIPKNNNSETPVKQDDININITKRTRVTAKPATSPPAPVSKQREKDDDSLVSESVTADLVTEIRLFREEMRSAVQEFRSAISNLTCAVDSCNRRIDDLECRIEAMEQQPKNDPVNNNIQTLEQTIIELKLDLNDRDQELLSNDIDIAGVPEENSERCTHLVLSIAQKLGVPLEEREVVSAYRAGPLRRAASEHESASRPRPLVVRLARRTLRDQLLAAARVRRDVTSAGIGLTSPARRIYINERLTPDNRLLLYKARSESVRAQWKYVWTREGKIYARKEQGSSRMRLRSETDIVKVFGH